MLLNRVARSKFVMQKRLLHCKQLTTPETFSKVESDPKYFDCFYKVPNVKNLGATA